MIPLLAILYLVQGLPFGFQTKTLPVLLRAQGASLSSISSLNFALSLPWFIKVLWAPLVDAHYVPRIGKRRSWLLPTQGCLLLGCLATSLLWETPALLFVCVFAMNMAASVQDIAVDALAVDLLRDDELGMGNAAQSVGFKVGMLLGGGVLVWVTDEILGLSTTFVFLAMAAIVASSILAVLRFDEPQAALSRGASSAQEGADGEEDSATLTSSGGAFSFGRIMWATWTRVFREVAGLVVGGREACCLLAFIASYKSGELMADVMFKPFLVDLGHTPASIGLWTGLYSMVFSITGSLLGGFVAKHVPVVRAVLWCCVLRLVPHIGRCYLAASSEAPPSVSAILGVSCLESLIGGMLTTVVFALMMAQVDNKELGGSHYTLLTTVEVSGKSICSFLAGPFTQHFGYFNVFTLATILSTSCILFLLPLLEKESTVKKKKKKKEDDETSHTKSD